MFTSDQLLAHIDKVIAWWETEADRILQIVDRKGSGLTAALRERAKQHHEGCFNRMRHWTQIRAMIPPNEEFLLTLAEAKEIDFPTHAAWTDQELEHILMTPPQPNPLIQLLFGSRSGDPNEI